MDLKAARAYLYETVIKRTFGEISPATGKNEHGKPSFLPPFDDHYFNISHSGDFVVMAMGDSPVGVDVERTGRTKDFKKLLRFFYDHEKNRVLKAPDGEDEFYKIWTFREAFSKLVGVGLVLYSHEEITIDYDKNKVSYNDKDYGFYEYDIKTGYRLSLCVPGDIGDFDIEVIRIE